MNTRLWLLSLMLLFFSACGPTPGPAVPSSPPPTATRPSATATITLTPTTTPTPTPLPVAQPAATDTPPPASPCRDLSGSLEIQMLVGPSDAVGLEPTAVGSLPWQVFTDTPPYLLAGDTLITYQDTLIRDWGSFDVQMTMDFVAEGTCDDAGGGGTLDLTVTMDGEQLVTVTSEGFSAEYPWSGSEARHISFPLQEGATASGEGWAFVLHLN